MASEIGVFFGSQLTTVHGDCICFIAPSY